MVRGISPDSVALVRRFNRTVTERIGALEESFLGRDRPLGASRLLWEVREDGARTFTGCAIGWGSTRATPAASCDGWRTRAS